jgi:hypothetical protein
VEAREAVFGPAAFASNRLFSKGRLGLIRKGIYVGLGSSKNEVKVRGSAPWVGLDVPAREVVFLSAGRVWSAAALPKDFDLAKAVVISFEGDQVRFFDFNRMSGGYYERLPAQ